VDGDKRELRGYILNQSVPLTVVQRTVEVFHKPFQKHHLSIKTSRDSAGPEHGNVIFFVQIRKLWLIIGYDPNQFIIRTSPYHSMLQNTGK
jgi:hypothetical protein